MDPVNIQVIVLDVDGVLTDGRVTLGEHGDVGKRFNVRDGFAIKRWQAAGRRTAILSGRYSHEVALRAKELGIEVVRQNAGDKAEGLREVLRALDLSADCVAYMGDDVPDEAAMGRCHLRVTVADAASSLKRAAHFVTRRRGGEGAVAEFIEWLMRKQGRWSS